MRTKLEDRVVVIELKDITGSKSQRPRNLSYVKGLLFELLRIHSLSTPWVVLKGRASSRQVTTGLRDTIKVSQLTKREPVLTT